MLRPPNDSQDAREKCEIDYAHIRMEKHLTGNIADIIVVDNINTGNAIFKSLSVLSDNWYPACFIMGAKNTVLLNSRGATMETLTHNIVLAAKD